MKQLHKMPLQKLIKSRVINDGGDLTKINAEVVYGGFSAVKKIVKSKFSKGKILFISTKQSHEMLWVKLNKSIKNLSSVVINKRFDNSLENISALFAIDDVLGGVIVSDSDLISVATYFSSIKNVPLIIMPKSCDVENILAGEVSINFRGKKEKIAVTNKRYVVINKSLLKNAEQKSNAVAFSGIASGIIAIIDYRVKGIVADKWLCRESYDIVRACITDAMNVLKFKKQIVSLKLLEIKIKLSIAEYFTGGEFFGGSGGNLVADFLEASGKEVFSTSERRFLAAYKLIDIYNMFFTKEYDNLLALPDYVLRAKNCGEITGENQFKCLERIRKIAVNPTHIQEKLSLHKEKLASETQRFSSIKEKLFLVYKKLGGDEKLLSNYTSTELRKAIYHAPDSGKTVSVLSLIRDVGILELLKN